MGEELAIGSRHLLPVDTVHVGLIEPFGFLLADVVEHVGTLGSQVHFDRSAVIDRFECFTGSSHFLDGASAQDEDVAFLVHLHVCPSRVHLVEQAGVACAQLHLP